MENPEELTPKEHKIYNKEKEMIKEKEYTIDNNNILYKLKMMVNDNEILSFKLKQINKLSDFYYFKNYNYEEIKKELNLEEEKFQNINEIFYFFDSIINKNKIKLIQENNKKICLNLININSKQFHISLEEKISSTKENLRDIINEINEMKNDRELINQLIKNNEYLSIQNQKLLENQQLLIEQIRIMNMKLNNNNSINNNLIKECPRCDGKGKVPKYMIWNKEKKIWSYLDKYKADGLYYNFILDECPLCKGNKSIDITKYTRCPDCSEICGYNKNKFMFFDDNYEFCKTCKGSGYLYNF